MNEQEYEKAGIAIGTDHITKRIDTLFENQDSGFYIECGANDGVTQSNTLRLEQKGWRGLLVEANPYVCPHLIANRSKDNIFHNVALVSKEYYATSQHIMGNFDRYSLEGRCSHIPEYFNEEMKSLAGGSHNVKVPARTLEDLLLDAGIIDVDFFSLDVENFEIEVLNGIDLSKFNIKYILAETYNRLYYHDVMKKYLEQLNYKFVERLTGNDDLYIKL